MRGSGVHFDKMRKPDIEQLAIWHEQDIQSGHYRHPGANINAYLTALASGRINVMTTGGPEVVQTNAVVILYNKKLAGFIALRPWALDQNFIELWAFSVAPHMQRMGIGREALKKVCEVNLPRTAGIYARCLPASEHMCKLLKRFEFKHRRTSPDGITTWLLNSQSR